jgi:hypothetical protein
MRSKTLRLFLFSGLVSLLIMTCPVTSGCGAQPQEVPSDGQKPRDEVPTEETPTTQEEPTAEDQLSGETDVVGLSVGELAELLTYPKDTANSLADMVQS